MYKKIKKVNNLIEKWCDKQNTNSTAMIIFDLIYEFSSSEQKPYTKVKMAYNKFEDINIDLLNAKNWEAYEVITSIINTLENESDAIAKLTNDLNEHKWLKDYYRNLVQAYAKEVLENPIKTKIAKGKNKQLLLKNIG